MSLVPFNEIENTYVVPNIRLNSTSTTTTKDLGQVAQVMNYHSDEVYDASSTSYISTGATTGSTIYFNPDPISNEKTLRVKSSYINSSLYRISKIHIRMRVVNTYKTFSLQLWCGYLDGSNFLTIGDPIVYDPSNNQQDPDFFNYIDIYARNVVVPQQDSVIFLKIETSDLTGQAVFYPVLATSDSIISQDLNGNATAYNLVTCVYDTEIVDMSGNSGQIAQNTADIEYLEQNALFKDGNQAIDGGLNLTGNLDASNVYVNGEIEVTSAEGTGKLSSGDGAVFLESSVDNGLINFSQLNQTSPAVSIQTNPSNMYMTCYGPANFQKQINVTNNVNCQGAFNSYGTSPYLVLNSTDTSNNKTTIKTSNDGTEIYSNTDVHFQDASNNDRVIVYHEGGSALQVKANLDMAGSKINNVAPPALDQDASNKAYCDNKLLKSGGTMTGTLNMGSNRITGLATPVSTTDAVTKAYVDGISPHSDTTTITLQQSGATMPNIQFNNSSGTQIGNIGYYASGDVNMGITSSSLDIDTPNGISLKGNILLNDGAGNGIVTLQPQRQIVDGNETNNLITSAGNIVQYSKPTYNLISTDYIYSFQGANSQSAWFVCDNDANATNTVTLIFYANRFGTTSFYTENHIFFYITPNIGTWNVIIKVLKQDGSQYPENNAFIFNTQNTTKGFISPSTGYTWQLREGGTYISVKSIGDGSDAGASYYIKLE